MRAESGGQADHDARNAAIAHQKIGAHADDADAHIGGLRGKKRRQIVRVRGTEQNFRRAAGAEPDEILQRRVLGIGAAHRRKRRRRAGSSSRRASRAFSAASSPAAHCVIEPAPRQTIAPPGFAESARPAAADRPHRR